MEKIIVRNDYYFEVLGLSFRIHRHLTFPLLDKIPYSIASMICEHHSKQILISTWIFSYHWLSRLDFYHEIQIRNIISDKLRLFSPKVLRIPPLFRFQAKMSKNLSTTLKRYIKNIFDQIRYP